MKKLLSAALAGLMVACGQNHAETAHPTTDTVATLTPSETIISVNRSGTPTGRTVILIPGLASHSNIWADTTADLSAFDVRTVQVKGFGDNDSSRPEGNYTDAIATSIQNHLLTHPGEKPVLIGHSMGGFVALKAALLGGVTIDELIIVDSLPFLAEMFMPGSTPEQAAASAPMITAQMSNMPRDIFDAQQAAGLPRLAKTQTYHPVLETWGQASDQFTVAAVMGEMLGADLRSDISEINAKITVIAAHDPAMGIEQSRVRDMFKEQYKAAPDYDVLVVDNSFHFIMVDQKEAFLDIVKSALKD